MNNTKNISHQILVLKIQTVARTLCILAFVLLHTLSANCQWYDPEKVDDKVQLIYETAYELALKGAYEQSIEKLTEALAIEPKYVEAYLSRAGVHASLKDYQKSVADFDKGIEMDSIFSLYYLLPYSISLAGAGDFERALEAVNRFLMIDRLNSQSIKAANYRKRTYEFAINFDKKYPDNKKNFIPVGLGSGVNTDYLEYYPSMSIDGNTLIFNRRVDADEDFYQSEKINGKWSVAHLLEGKLNTNFNEGAQTFSADGECLIFTGCNYPEGYGNCDLYLSYKNKNGEWMPGENLGPFINTDLWESTPSLSAEKQVLYFSSSQDGGYGGKDIWMCKKVGPGRWGKPVNAGPAINTSGDETCPFIHADNTTFYFNSNGHLGYGQSDVFVSKKINDSTFTTPLNLGYPINTIDDEGSLFVAADGKTAYYSSDRFNTGGGLDIYTFTLPSAIKATRTFWVRGKVYDIKTKSGLPSMIHLTAIDSLQKTTSIQTDEDGNYLVTLPEGSTYGLDIYRKGYLFYSNRFTLEQAPDDSFYIIDVPLQVAEAGAKVILKNIVFDYNKATINIASFGELDNVVKLLNDNPTIKLSVEGHTDNTGGSVFNKNLSINRAKAVVDYLVQRGIAKGRLVAKGFGDSMPIDNNSTEQGKSNNRRTEIHVLSN